MPIAERFADGDDHFKSRLADAHALLADVAQERGDREAARRELRKVVPVLETLAKPGAAFETNRTLIFAMTELAGLDEAAGDGADAARLRQSALARFVESSLDLNEEHEIMDLAQTCAQVATSRDARARETVRRAIAILEPLKIVGANPRPRLALLAQARRAVERP